MAPRRKVNQLGPLCKSLLAKNAFAFILRHMKRLIAAFLGILAGCSASYDHYAKLGRNALGHGEYRQALDFFDLADAMAPEGVDFQSQMASVSRGLGQQQLDQKRCDLAEEAFLKAERTGKLDRESSLIDHRALYDCYLEQEAEPDTEVRVLRHLFQLGESRMRLLNRLAQLEAETGGDTAVTRMLQIDEKTPLTHTDREALVAGLRALRRDPEALHHQEILVNAYPYEAMHRLQLADICENVGQRERSQVIYEQMLKDYPANPALYLRYGDFLRRQGDQKKAQRMKDEADRLRGIDVSPRQLRDLPKSRR